MLIAGNAFGQLSPVETQSDTFYAELRLQKAAHFVMPTEIQERGIYLCEGSITIANIHYSAGSLIVLKPGQAAELIATEATLCMLLGGASLPGVRHLYWNFVSSSKARIEQAKSDWKAGRFDPVPGDKEFIPLPGE